MSIVGIGNVQESQDSRKSSNLISGEINVLVDTGALDGDYMSCRILGMCI